MLHGVGDSIGSKALSRCNFGVSGMALEVTHNPRRHYSMKHRTKTNEEKTKEKLPTIEEEKPCSLAAIDLTAVNRRRPSPAVCHRTFLVEMDVMFLEYAYDLDNLTGELSSMADNLDESNNGSSSQPPTTPTPRRRVQSQLLELKCYIIANGRISMMIAPGAKKPIFPHKQSWTNKAARQKQPYNHSNGSKSFLKRQHELAEQRRESVDRVELFRETHVRARMFVSQAREDVHNSSLSLPQRVVSHSLGMRYVIKCWIDDKATKKALVGDPSRRPAKRRVRAVPRRHVHSPQKERFNYKLSLIKLWNGLKSRQEITKR
ncbi:NBS-LRR type resistance protein [Cucumis melo var. makuwa]|uniref:NBS-LRR type resistance protein n=1 Tax=Cucumis melo var. makuwa TaxID=1194695 RepID=A0A5A7TIJ3_CUCMM|nr:NBS-LRR type resistance protein [Cucumis melo var. makuwa]TYK12315.1 NBS-LRR type resistance protein [Cucumis melo var. makuwa]